MSGYVDLQINGYAGVDFNQDDLSGESLLQACQALERDGVDGILATIITDSIPRMSARLKRLVELREQDPLIARMVWGLHIEGPFLNPEAGYIGAHPAQEAQPATIDGMKTLLDSAGGLAQLVTLAPEQDAEMQVTRLLADSGIVVAGGHSNASLDDLHAGIDAGLSLFTHLGNGCPAELPRHDNIIQRVLSCADSLWITFIADGAHVPFFALKNYLSVTGFDRAIIVTDAISAAGCGPGRFQLGNRWIDVGEDGVPRAKDHSHLIGSGTIMSRMEQNLKTELGLTQAEVDQLTRKNPRKLARFLSEEQV